MSTQKKYLTLHIRISVLVLMLGMLVKALKMPTIGDVTILLGFFAIATFYSLRFSKKEIKGAVTYIKLVLVLFWCLNGIFSILRLPFGEIFQTVSIMAFLFWTVMEGTRYFNKEKEFKVSISFIVWNIIMILGALSIVVGGLFKVLNWEYASYLLILGCSFILLFILRDVFPKNNEGQVID